MNELLIIFDKIKKYQQKNSARKYSDKKIKKKKTNKTKIKDLRKSKGW